MGMENDVMVEFLRDDRRFADLFNGGIFAGEQVVKAMDLEDGSESYTERRSENEKTEFASKKKASSKKAADTAPRSRDVKKRLKSGAQLRILAIEEQSKVDYTMPLRCMNYDSLEYGRQVRNIRSEHVASGRSADKNEFLCDFWKNDRLAPVYTICLYHGAEPWDGPRSLKEMMSFGSDEEREIWEREFSDYRMRLICVNELEDLTGFNTGLKELFAIMPYRKDKHGMRKFLEEHKEYQHLDEETAWTISGMMGVHAFMKKKEKYSHEGGYDMCQAIREMCEDERKDGISQGINQGISQGVARAVLGLLGARWEVSEELKEHIMAESDIEVLSGWNILAAKVESIEEFERQIINRK